MGSGSISNASVPAISKDLGKKKKGNRKAKLKQNKLDVRREQWLSQGNGRFLHMKNKATVVDSNGRSRSLLSSQITDNRRRLLRNSKLNTREADIESSTIHESDSESIITSSPVGSSFSQHDSVKDLGGSSSIASSRCCSGSVSEADEGDDCLDDWEAVADALITDKNSELETARKFKTNIEIAVPELPSKNSRIILEKLEHSGRTKTNCIAWHHDVLFVLRACLTCQSSVLSA